MTHDHEHDHINPSQLASKPYRRALWAVIILNFTMFLVEIFSGIASGSTSLLSDSLDFAGDAVTAFISIIVLNHHIHTRAKASLGKAFLMLCFATFIAATAIYRFFHGSVPQSNIMGIIGVAALCCNLSCAVILFKYREGDSNMLSVWLCTRNDAIGNVAVMLAALGVYLTNTNLPDLIVALIMSTLAINSSCRIIAKARHELAHH